MEKDLEEIKELYNDLKNHSRADDSTKTHEIYAELASLVEVPLLEDSTNSEWKSLSQYERSTIQMRPTMIIEQIAEELSKTAPVQISPFEVEVIL